MAPDALPRDAVPSDAGSDLTLRAAVRASVVARRPVDEREHRSQTTFLETLEILESPFDRYADPRHVTGSGIIIGDDGVLLLNHRKLHIWVQPGGHLEGGEAPWDAALRESVEETGLDLALAGGGRPTLLHVDVHPSAGGHTHLDLRYALTVTGDPRPRPPAGESQQVRWYTWPQAVSIADPGLAGLLRHLWPAATATTGSQPARRAQSEQSRRAQSDQARRAQLE